MGGSSSTQSSSTRGASSGQRYGYAASSGESTSIPLPFEILWSKAGLSGTTTASSSSPSASLQSSHQHVATSSASGGASSNVPKSVATADASTSKVQRNLPDLQETSPTNGPIAATRQVRPITSSTSHGQTSWLGGSMRPMTAQVAVGGNEVQKSTPASTAVQSTPRVVTPSLPAPIQSNQHVASSSASGHAIPLSSVAGSPSTADASTSKVQGEAPSLQQTSATNGPTSAATRLTPPTSSSTSHGQTSLLGASAVQSTQHVANLSLAGLPVIKAETFLRSGTTGILTSSLQGAASRRPRTIKAAPTKNHSPMDLGDSQAQFDPYSFDSPVAKKVTCTEKPTGFEEQTGSNELRISVATMTDEDIIIALAVKFSRVVVSGGSPLKPIHGLSDSMDIQTDVLERICEDYPALFQLEEGHVRCSVFTVETCYANGGQGRDRGRGRGRGRGGMNGSRGGTAHTSDIQADKRLKICYSYNAGTCRDHSACQRLHVCCKWLYGKCGNVYCLFEHTIRNNSRNDLKLSSFGVSQWKDDNLKLLFLAFEHQIPQLCKRYNGPWGPSGCRHGSDCKYFHVCTNFVNGDKVCENPCRLNHNQKQGFYHADQLVARLRLELSQVPKVSSIEDCYEVNRMMLPSNERVFKGSTGQGANKVTVWRFLDLDGSWKIQGLSVARVSFGLHTSLILEEAYQANELDELVLKIGIHTFKYSEARMEQTNRNTGKVRQLKREVVNAQRSLPPDWMPMDYASSADGAVLCPLEKTSAEFKKIQERFKENGGVPRSTVLEIYRVQNPYLQKGFNDKKAELIRIYKLNDGPVVEEKLLFHGTKGDVVKHICEQNFDWRRSGETTGTVYGQGAYFAWHSSYSHSYTSTVDDGTRLMFVASVLVGTKIRGASSMRYPPEWKETIQFDTTVNDEANPTIFVKYEKTEYYPAYIVQYHAE